VAVAIRASRSDPQPNELHWALLDTDGHTVTPPLYDALGEEYSEGLIAAAIAEPTPDQLNTRYAWGFVDTSGTWVISPRFGSAPSPFADGRSVLADPTTDRRGVIDRTGRVICPPEFTSLSPWRDGFAVAKKSERWLILDASFVVVAEIDVDQLEPFAEGLAEFRRHDRYGFIDTTGRIVVQPIFSSVFPYTDGRARVEIEPDRWGSSIARATSPSRRATTRYGNFQTGSRWCSSKRSGRTSTRQARWPQRTSGAGAERDVRLKPNTTSDATTTA